MEKFKILNLYACLGGNSYKWNEVAKEAGIEIEITAVELDPELARLYKERLPTHNVVVGDAHQYLLDHYKEFHLIWSSPPCPTHSRLAIAMKDKRKMNYPDMKLYQEIIFLDNMFKGKYVVENVIPYYQPLIPAKKRHRHLYWTNFNLPNILSNRKGGRIGLSTPGVKHDEHLKLLEFHEIDISSYKGTQRKDKIARNLVDYEAGKTILETVLGIYKSNNTNQTELF